MAVSLSSPISSIPFSTEFVGESSAWDAAGAQLTNRTQLSAEEWTELELLAFQHSASPETYDIMGSSSSLLRTPCHRGALSVLPDGRFWHVAGGLIASPHLKQAMIQWLKQISLKQRRTIIIYSIPTTEVNAYREAGFSVNKFGEEPMLDLGQIDWKGGAFEWVRRQTNFCLRAGLVVQEITCPVQQKEMSTDLEEILSDDLSERVYSRPLRLLEGEFNPHLLHRRRLFVARHEETGRVEGFLAASPMDGGKTWAFETYRKRSTAPKGTIPFLFRQVIDQLQSEGVSQVSLCVVPGKGVQQDCTKQSNPRIRWVMGFWYKRLNFIFNTAGQDFFKSRFRPRYVDRFVCAYPNNSLLAVASFIKTSGALRPNLMNLAHKCFSRQPPRPEAE